MAIFIKVGFYPTVSQRIALSITEVFFKDPTLLWQFSALLDNIRSLELLLFILLVERDLSAPRRILMTWCVREIVGGSWGDRCHGCPLRCCSAVSDQSGVNFSQ